MSRAVSANISEPTEDLADATATAREEAGMIVVICRSIVWWSSKTLLRNSRPYGCRVPAALPLSSVAGCESLQHPHS